MGSSLSRLATLRPRSLLVHPGCASPSASALALCLAHESARLTGEQCLVACLIDWASNVMNKVGRPDSRCRLQKEGRATLAPIKKKSP